MQIENCSYAWRDEDNVLHINLAAFLTEAGVPVNEQSMRVAEKVIRQQFNCPLIAYDPAKRADA